MAHQSWPCVHAGGIPASSTGQHHSIKAHIGLLGWGAERHTSGRCCQGGEDDAASVGRERIPLLLI